MGALADQLIRVRLLVYTIALWSVALVVGGTATSYLWLLLSRLALGGAIAAAGPLLASLVRSAGGDRLTHLTDRRPPGHPADAAVDGVSRSGDLGRVAVRRAGRTHAPTSAPTDGYS